MKLPTIEMPKQEAREKFLEYRHAVQERHSAEGAALDEQIMKGYRQMSLGKPLIDIEEAFRISGEDELHRPRLAIARADEKTIILDRANHGGFRLEPDEWSTVARSRRWQFRGLLSILGEPNERYRTEKFSAIVPIVPPHLRPRGSLERYAILWEAEWRRVDARQVPPRDPALLRPLGGNMYAVMAIWDLTDIERSVLGLR